MALQLDEYGRWPLWQAPADTGAPVGGGYGHVACFVSPDALENLPGLSAGVGAWVRRAADGSPAGVAKMIVERLYEQLRGCEVRYDTAPWQPGAGQRLRHPGWALSPRESATCVDFAILFAAMCLRERLAPFLVFLRGDHDGVPVGHVMVGVDLDRAPQSPTEAAPLAACAGELPIGVSRVTEREFLLVDPGVLLVDVTLASLAHHASFEQAVSGAAQALALPDYRDVHLVDVAVRQHDGDTPLPAPTGRAALRRRLPGPRHALERFPSRAQAAARLAALSPRMVVIGHSGVGKSELARDAAARVDQGLGWFLTATNEAALVASLAEAELAESGREAGELDNVDRTELARGALNRLARVDTPWVVVVDNADCPPAKLRKWLPAPDPAAGQVLIVTTTCGDWRGDSGQIINVDALEPEEVAALLGDARLVELAAGRPLLVQAFLDARHYLNLSPQELGAQLAGAEAELDDLTGPRALWALLRDALTPEAADAARALAWLLPDRTPVDALAHAGFEAGTAAKELLNAGLVGRPGDVRAPVVSLHRLFGSAIRADLRAHSADRVMVTRLLAVPEVHELLLAGADAEITGQLADSLIDRDPAASPASRDRGRGMALWALGAMQEMHQGAATSAATYAHAMAYLDEHEQKDRPLIADCLHGRARQINQQRRPSADAVAQARRWMARAIELREETDLAGRSKHRALDGLLLQRHARDGLPFASAEQIAGLREAQHILEQSWRERRGAGADPRLVDRAYFNRAGVRVDLAQRVPSEAVELLTVAEQVYRETFAFRRIAYRDPSPLTAASHNGLATCLYYRAALDPDADRDALLVEATSEAVMALDQRRVTDGDRDGGDAVKSASILAKIALSRVQAAGKEPFADLLADLDRELRTS